MVVARIVKEIVAIIKYLEILSLVVGLSIVGSSGSGVDSRTFSAKTYVLK